MRLLLKKEFRKTKHQTLQTYFSPLYGRAQILSVKFQYRFDFDTSDDDAVTLLNRR